MLKYLILITLFITCIGCTPFAHQFSIENQTSDLKINSVEIRYDIALDV